MNDLTYEDFLAITGTTMDFGSSRDDYPTYYPTWPTPAIDFIDQTIAAFNFDHSFSLPKTATVNKPFNRPEVVPERSLTFPANTPSLNFDAEFFQTNIYSSFPSPIQLESRPNSDSESSKQKQRVRKPRPQRAALGLSYANFQVRLKTLMGDPFVRRVLVEKNKVQCSGCEKFIQLDNRKPKTLHLQNWKTHKRRCDGIKEQINPGMNDKNPVPYSTRGRCPHCEPVDHRLVI